MYNPNINFCLNTLSTLIDSEIVFFTTCKKYHYIPPGDPKIQKKKKNKEMKEELACICKDSIFFIGLKTNGVKRRIYFDNLERVQLDLDKDQNFLIYLTKPVSNDILMYEFDIQNRPVFFEMLACYYSMYYAQKYGKLQELPFKYKMDWGKSFGEHLLRGLSLFPDQKEIKAFNLYRFKLNSKYKYIQNPENPNIFERIFTCEEDEMTDRTQKDNMINDEINGSMISPNSIPEDNDPKSKSNNSLYAKYIRKSTIKVEIEREMPIEKLLADDALFEFTFYAYQKLFDYIHEYLKSEKVMLLEHEEYAKPGSSSTTSDVHSPDMNIDKNKDISIWETQIFYCRTKPNSQKRGYNYIFIFSRRKFIPPLFETYNDFSFILQHEYIDEEGFIDIDPEAVSALQEAFDSLEPEVLLPRNAICEKFIRMKLEAYMVDPVSLMFLYKNGITGTDSYKLGLDYTYKLILMLHEYVKDQSSQVKEIIREKIQEAYLRIDNKDLNMDEYEKIMEITDIFTIREKRDTLINNYFHSTDKKITAVWKNKITTFLSFCANGGLIDSRLDYCDFIQWSRRIQEFSKQINPVLKDFLNLQVITVHDELLEPPTISNIVSNIVIVKEITFNDYLMAKLIHFGLLNKIHEVESDIVYFDFLNFLLEKNCSRRILDGIHHYFLAMSEDLGTEAVSLKKNSSIFLPTLIKHFSNFYQAPKILKIIGKCLIILADYDKLNKCRMLNDNMILLICRYLSSPDVTFVNTSIKLFSVISSAISDSKDTFKEIFMRHPNVLCKLINILKGTGVPGSYYRQSTIILVLDFFINLANDFSSKEILFDPKYKKFIKYPLRFLFWNPEGESYNYEIQQKVYELLDTMVTKNSELRKYIQNNFKLLTIIDNECKGYLEMLESLLEEHQYQKDKDATMKMLFCMLKLINNFVGSDLVMVQNALLVCSNLSKLVMKLMQSQDQEEVKPLMAQVKEINENIFGRKE